MSINRYRLRHAARNVVTGQPGWWRNCYRRPDRLIGLILLGNNLANIAASALVTVIAIRLGGQGAIVVGRWFAHPGCSHFCRGRTENRSCTASGAPCLSGGVYLLPAAQDRLSAGLVGQFPCQWAIDESLDSIRRAATGDSLSQEELRSVVAGVRHPATEASQGNARRHTRS